MDSHNQKRTKAFQRGKRSVAEAERDLLST